MALYVNPGYENTAVGAQSLINNGSGSTNCAVGYGTLYNNTSGYSNTAMGYSSLSGNIGGYDNSAFGRDALRNNRGTYGVRNSAVGAQALLRTTNSQFNTAIGYNAGWQYDLGWNNTILGANSDGRFAGQYNIVAIGQGVICPDNSTARIGNSATWSIGGYTSWTNFSDGRFKKQVEENVKGLDFIMKLRPVTYHLDIAGVSKQSGENAGQDWDDKMKQAITEKEKVLFSGFVAQEVEEAAKASGYDFSGVDKPRTGQGYYGLRYSDFVVPLVKAMQEQQLVIEELKKKINALEKKNGMVNSPKGLSIYPNPSTGKVLVNIAAEDASKALIKIFDSKGALVKQEPVSLMQGNNTIHMDVKNLSAGAYNITAEWGNGKERASTKMVKQ
jgi:hypothetical protein